MGRIVRFDPNRQRRKRRWTRASDYGVRRAPRPPRFGTRKRRLRRAWFAVRPWLFLALIVALAALWQTPGYFEPPAFLQSEPRVVEGAFPLCGPGRTRDCTIDGDTFRLGLQTVRVVGIDTAEKDARCAAEAAQADASTAALRDWLENGPFQLTTRIDEPTDRYNRTLGIVKRVREDGTEDRLADWMIAHGGARSYGGGGRGGWC